MIRLSDALILSITKLKTRRVRLIVTTVVSGLFFVLLAFASVVFNGTTNSLEKFSEDGFGKRYIARVDSALSSADYSFYEDKLLLEKAKQADKELIAAKKAEAKRLGISYDELSEMPSVTEAGPNGGEYLQITPQSAGLVDQYRAEAHKGFFDALNQAVEKYDVIGVHNGVTLGNSFSGLPNSSPTVSFIKDDKEIKTSQDSFGQTGFQSITMGVQALDEAVMQSFVLEGQSLAIDESGSVPVVAPFSAAEEALGLSKLSSSSTSEQRLERLKEVREKAAGLTFQICLRNQTSLDRQSLAEQQQTDLKTNGDKKEYFKPELLYDISTAPCSDVLVVRDSRSFATKAYDEKQKQFDEKFGKKPSEQRLVTFKVVGITADSQTFMDGFSVKSLIASFMSSNLGSGWFIPMSARAALPEYETQFSTIGKFASYDNITLVEFGNAEEAKRFAKEQTCQPNFNFSGNFEEACVQNGTPFFVTSYGSNSVAISDARNWFSGAFIKTGLVIAAISAIIMMGTVGKVIADSRRETAVFRAIGAKRIDIAAVYLLYSFLLGLIIVVFSIGAGTLLGLWFSGKYSGDATIDALTIFNSQDLTRSFTLFGIDVSQLIRLAGIIMSAALVSSVLPLFNNLKRNPIKDMRDER